MGLPAPVPAARPGPADHPLARTRRTRLTTRLLAGAAVALLLLLPLALLVLPGWLDWTRYRDTIESLASSATERPVRIAGPVTLELLPQPVLTAGGVQFGDTGDGIALSARELRLRVGLPALFGGKLDVRELTLRGAALDVAWPLRPGASAQRPPAWVSGLQARVEEGRLRVGAIEVTGIDASLGADPVTGTLSAAGSGAYAGRAWRFTVRLGSPGRDGSATAEASIDGQGPVRDTGGTFTGQIGGDGTVQGRVFGRGPDLAAVLPAPPVAWRADGRLIVSGGLAVADDLALQIGGSPARGAVALRVAPEPRLDLAVAASQLDLDAWLPVLVRGTEWALPTTLDLSAEAASLAGGTVRGLRGAFDLGADGAVVRDAAAILPGEARVALSGQIRRDAARGGVPRFDGEARMAAPDLRTTLRWTQPLFPALLPGLLERLPAAGLLRTAQLRARLGMEPGQVQLAGLRGTLDGAGVEGELTARPGGRQAGQPGGQPPDRPYLGAGLRLDALPLDLLLPDPAAILRPASLADARQAAAAVDAELRLEVRRPTWRGQGLDVFALDAQAAGGKVQVRRLEASGSGLRLAGTGTLQEDGRVAELRLDLQGADAAVLRPSLPAGWRAGEHLLRGRFSAQVQASGPLDALAVRASAELGDLRAEAQPTIDLGARRVLGPVSLRHPGAPRLLERLGITGTAGWLGDGSFSLVAQAELRPGRVTVDSFSMSAGSLRASGQLATAWDAAAEGGAGAEAGEGPVLTGRIAAETLPLPLPFWRSPDPLPTTALRGWRASVAVEAGQVLLDLAPAAERVSAALSLAGGVLRLENGAGSALGGAWTASAVLDVAAGTPRVAVQAEVADAALPAPLLGLPLDIAAGRLSLRAEASASGYSPAALAATVAGKLSGTARDGMVTGFDLASLDAALRGAALGDAAGRAAVPAAAAAALGDGRSAFAELDLSATAERGVVRLDGTRLVGPSGTASLTGTADLSSGTVDLRVALRPGASDAEAAAAPEAAFVLTGPADAPRRTPELAPVLRWLAERRQPAL